MTGALARATSGATYRAGALARARVGALARATDTAARGGRAGRAGNRDCGSIRSLSRGLARALLAAVTLVRSASGCSRAGSSSAAADRGGRSRGGDGDGRGIRSLGRSLARAGALARSLTRARARALTRALAGARAGARARARAVSAVRSASGSGGDRDRCGIRSLGRLIVGAAVGARARAVRGTRCDGAVGRVGGRASGTGGAGLSGSNVVGTVLGVGESACVGRSDEGDDSCCRELHDCCLLVIKCRGIRKLFCVCCLFNDCRVLSTNERL